MRAKLAFLFCLYLCVFASSLQSAPVIAARLSLQPGAYQAIAAKVAAYLDAPLPSEYRAISQMEIFLIKDKKVLSPEERKKWKFDEIGTLTPVIFFKAPEAVLPLLQKKAGLLFEFKQRGGWTMALGRGNDLSALSEETLQSLIKMADESPSAPFWLTLNPAAAVEFLRETPSLAESLKNPAYSSLLDEFASLEGLEVRGSGTGESLRLVLIAQAKPDTPLFTLWDERLPSHVPREAGKIGITGALGYGYSLYNPEIASDYLQHIEEMVKASFPDLACHLNDLREALRHSKGYAAFIWMPGEKSPRSFNWGSWDNESAGKLLLGQSRLGASIFQKPGQKPAMNVTMHDAFLIGETPVYKINFDVNETTQGLPPQHEQIFFALRSGSILVASSGESLTEFVQQMDSPEGPTLAKAFTPYPTISGQWKVDTDALMDTLSQGAWDRARVSGFMYSATSLSKGRAAMTLDIPVAFLDNLAQFARTQAKKQADESEKKQKQQDSPSPEKQTIKSE